MRKYYESNIKKLYVLEEVINILDLELCCLEGIKNKRHSLKQKNQRLKIQHIIN